MSDPTHQIFYSSCALATALTAAVWDVKSRRIPNWLTDSSLMVGLLFHLALNGPAQAGLALVSALISGGIFLLFHIAGGMGAGDVKLMAAIGCMVGLQGLFPVLTMTAIMGGVLALVVAISRGKLKQTVSNIGVLVMHHRMEGLTPHSNLNVKNQQTLRLPYAVPIAAGCLIAFCSMVCAR